MKAGIEVDLTVKFRAFGITFGTSYLYKVFAVPSPLDTVLLAYVGKRLLAYKERGIDLVADIALVE